MSQGQRDSNVNEFNKFLENNADFLSEKYNEYFKKKSIPLKELNTDAVIKYIYDVFSFNKYQGDEKMNQTLIKSLLQNIKDYTGELTKKKKQFNDATAVELLKFCIENNQMFAVKYDKKDKKMKTEERPEQPSSPAKIDSQTQNKNQDVQQQPSADIEDAAKDQEQKPDEEAENIIAANNSSVFGNTNQFGVAEPIAPKPDTALIKKNLQLMFEFYCRQQQNVGVNTTFDRISHQCHTMTIGKFISFCGLVEIKSDKIDKALLMRKFKMVAAGRKQIEFEQFYELMQMFAMMDEAIIPRLGVDDRLNFKNKLKERSRAFNTQDLTSRDVRRDSIFIPKLTGHSGKPSDALAEQMKVRKFEKSVTRAERNSRNIQSSGIRNMATPPRKDRYSSQLKKSQLKDVSQIINTKDVTSSQIRDFEDDMSFLQKMISHEENDEQWLKDYKIPNKKKASVVNPMLPPRLQPRKESIVPNIRKRVEELQRTETRQTTELNRHNFTSGYRQKNSKSILS